MTMYTEYAELYKTYTQKYGPKTAIFLMVGSFYELYDIQNNETGHTTCNVRDITDYLGIQLSVKKADISVNCDGLFAGFPDSAVHKWAGRLTSSGWTVVIVDQEKDSRGKVIARNVVRILSPSTHLEHMSLTDTPYIVALYFQTQSGQPPACGAGALDLTTGTTRTYTGTAAGRPDLWTADEMVQFISVFPPKEIWIGWYDASQHDSASPMPNESHFRRLLGQASNVPIHLYSMNQKGPSELARSETFQQCYGIKSLLPPHAYLGLRSIYEEMALFQLLHFVEEHHPSMLHSFHRNEPWSPHERLICGNHALTQLQLTGPCLKETVLGIFDKCITSMGKRAIKERLMSPYSDAATICTRLKEITEYQTWPDSASASLERQLRFMFDLPRLHRKILCGTICPVDIAGLFQTYTAMNAVRTLTEDTVLRAPFTEDEWISYQAICHTHWDQEKAQTPSADVTPLNGQRYSAILAKETEISETWNAIYAYRHEIAAAAHLSDDAIRVEERDKEPFGFRGSTITFQQLKKNHAHLPEGITFSLLKSVGWIDSPLIQKWNTTLQKQREALASLYQIHGVEACQAISDAGRIHWTNMEKWICHVDGTQCVSRVSQERGFSCPYVEHTDPAENKGSALEIVNLRHPLVEATASRAAYVTHDVQLGYTGTNGWLIYGMNASGKSTLMKATGLCILLAQAGCFVPATKMRFRPFRSIYTRILNQDNLFAGLSSFAVEMSELRDILRHADPYTLVLGDELCSGTESISAQALVASGIQWLAARDAKYMFATHLHGIPDLLPMKENKMEVWHLHVEYSPATKLLVYERSLRPGKGSSLYGLEVARAMDLPFEFMEQAVRHRHRLMGTTSSQEAPTSSWNRQIVRKECEHCRTPIQSALEVHHVQERHTARHGILPDGTPMNDSRNLMVLCQACHDAVHANQIEIGPIRQTSEGPIRIMYSASASSLSSSLSSSTSSFLSVSPRSGSSAISTGKWTTEEREAIINTLHTYSSMSLKALRARLDAKHGIQISETMLGKMRKEIREAS